MKQRYDLVLLDADDTLFDFAKAERKSFFLLLDSLGIQGDEALYQWYSKVNQGYWELLSRGKLSKEEVVVRRFEDLAGRLELSIAAPQLNRQFQQLLQKASYLLDGAEEVCRELSHYCTLAVATNGVAKTQRARLEGAAVRPYISHVVISEEAGAEKPSARFFDYAFALCGSYPKSRVLMVGDSIVADIRGGSSYGLDTCWINPHKLPAPKEAAATYQIASIRELTGIVLPDWNRA